jgi:hypothetical protein
MTTEPATGSKPGQPAEPGGDLAMDPLGWFAQILAVVAGRISLIAVPFPAPPASACGSPRASATGRRLGPTRTPGGRGAVSG